MLLFFQQLNTYILSAISLILGFWFKSIHCIRSDKVEANALNVQRNFRINGFIFQKKMFTNHCSSVVGKSVTSIPNEPRF